MCGGIIGFVIFLIGKRRQKVQSNIVGRQLSLKTEVRGTLWDYIESEGPIGTEICFLGVSLTSHVGPVYMIKASRVYQLSDLGSWDDSGNLSFNKQPIDREANFVNPSFVNRYVPKEIAKDVLGLLNGAMASPFPAGRLKEASDLITSSVPWEAVGSYGYSDLNRVENPWR